MIELTLIALAAVMVILVGGAGIERWMVKRGLGNEDEPPPT